MSVRTKIVSLLSLSAIAMLGHGCNLESAPNWGEVCPPGDGVRGQLSYIYAGAENRCFEGDGCYADAFLYDVCPREFSKCNVDEEGTYYCATVCPSGQLACDGKCIEPLTNSDYCGAEDTCRDSGASCCKAYTKCGAGEACVNGKCEATSCTAGQTKCAKGIVSTCSLAGKWEQTKTCSGLVCNAENTECPNESPCAIDGAFIAHGSQGCNGDKTQILQCHDGVVQEVETCRGDERCVESAGKWSCAIPVYSSCLFENAVVEHGKAICDGDRVRTCEDGKLSEAKTCSAGGKTACRDGECVFPTCLYKGVVVANGSTHCEGTILRTCETGILSEGIDCRENPDGKFVCRLDKCDYPKPCPLEDATLEHGESMCRGVTLLTCNDGNAVEENCMNTGYMCLDNGKAQCAPHFTSIKSIRSVFDQIYPEAECNQSEAFLDASVDLVGVVTAMRTANGNYGFVLQEPGEDPRYSGIVINCRNKEECQTYSDGTSIEVGDNVRVRANQLNAYFCQLQVYQSKGSPTIEKLASTDKIQPVRIRADELDTLAEYEPNNPYNSVLIQIDTVTATASQDSKPTGWKGIDGDGKDVFVNQLIYMDGNMPLKAESTYRITGIGVWHFNKSAIAPRDQKDIDELDECANASDKTGRCIWRKGSQLAITCENGKRVGTENCTAGDKVCDLNESSTVVDGATVKSLFSYCRARAKCRDTNENVVLEGEKGCFNESTLATCTFNSSCTDEESCLLGVMSNRTTCSNLCNIGDRECNAPAVNRCEFTSLDVDNAMAKMRVEDIADANVEAYIYCTTDPAMPLADWEHKTRLLPAASCETCPEGISEYWSMVRSLPVKDGAYSCVAVAQVGSGKAFACPRILGIATLLNGTTLASDSWIVDYEIGNLPKVLASWNFNSDCMALSSGIKTESVFRLNGSSIAKCSDASDKYVYAQAPWSKSDEADLTSNLYWRIDIDTKGYQNLTLSFETRSSKAGNKMAVAYRIGDEGAFVAIGEPITIPNEMMPFEIALPDAVSDTSRVTIGLFPYKTSYTGNSGPNIRFDNVSIKGLAI